MREEDGDASRSSKHGDAEGIRILKYDYNVLKLPDIPPESPAVAARLPAPPCVWMETRCEL
jgi:hypothetical protein